MNLAVKVIVLEDTCSNCKKVFTDNSGTYSANESNCDHYINMGLDIFIIIVQTLDW